MRYGNCDTFVPSDDRGMILNDPEKRGFHRESKMLFLLPPALITVPVASGNDGGTFEYEI